MSVPIVTMQLRGHLTRTQLARALQPVTASLAGSATIGLVVDALAMTGYDTESRTEFVAWNRQYRRQIRAVAILTSNLLWRSVIVGMSLASSQTMKAFAYSEDALRWLRPVLNQASPRERFTCELRVGRLAELRLGRIELADIDLLQLRIAELARLVAPRKLILLSDFRDAQLLSQTVVLKWSRFLLQASPLIEREAVLCPAGAPGLFAQAERSTRELLLRERQVFTEAGAARRWLGERLNADEQQRTAEFLRELSLPS